MDIQTVTVQVAVKIEPNNWKVTSHDGRVMGEINLCAPNSYYANCYTGHLKKGEPINVWSAGYETLDKAVEEIVAEHYPKVAA